MNATFTLIHEAKKPGEYKSTHIDEKKELSDIRIIYCGGGYTIAVKQNVSISGRGVRHLGGNTYIVTEKKLKELKRLYSVVADF